MPKLFSSTTANSSYSLFVGPRDADLFNDYNTELLEIVSNQYFNYWPVSVDQTDPNSLYGEAERKIPDNPVKVYGWVMLDEPETRTGEFPSETRRRIELYLHIDRLTEVGIFPKKGDFIEWDTQMFEIIEAFVPQFVHGLVEVKVGVTVRAISTRENVFSPRSDGVYEDRIEQGSEEPY